MQIFSCPFCGPRPEYEFHFGGDQGNTRPEGFDAVSAERWSDYLSFRNNPKGMAREIWMHMVCGELFAMERDTVTMAAKPGLALGPHEADV
ncbi:sarcosine oxidase subunit delta [Allorhizobium terrae]|uniref:Sarcosine oxidase subunit delta n=1 Tax=Allorhizobium terrae TaxID=1848972 RepID=A0A4S3ZR39_9HYPH|nr:sarcosine oxidase subunit delta [Allorhizobium terrae]THF47983.1 sarcosine oxidase subunit delta [Allorhizobium terrae]TWD48546.1 sarcosine oxidase subunit delta [Agrobacterium vitis]